MLVYDIEADNLLDDVTKVHCLNIYNTRTKKSYRFNDHDFSNAPRSWRRPDGSIRDGMDFLDSVTDIGGHNVHEYDNPVLLKLYGWKPKAYVHDSRAYSRLLYPTLKETDFAALRKKQLPEEFKRGQLIGRHSLKAWGYRLGEYKGDFEGPWDTFTQEMDDYCEQDIIVNARLFEHLFSRNPGGDCMELENKVASIIARQQAYGWLFDMQKAERLVAILQAERAEVGDQLKEIFQPWWAPKFTKGTAVFTPKRDNKKMGYTEGCPFTKVQLMEFNPSSDMQIADRLMKLRGWKPSKFTDKGQPSMDETVLGALPYPEAKQLARYKLLQKRLGALAEGKGAWIKCVREDGRIHGRVNSNGAVTGRMTHSKPNQANVPASGSEYGEECRELFTVPPGKKLVGCDASGLEFRCLAHYAWFYRGGKQIVEAVMNGDKSKGTDIHTLNAKSLGIPRRHAKTVFYAYMYGGGDEKLGTIMWQALGNKKRAGKRQLRKMGGDARAKLESGLQALGLLQDGVQKTIKKRSWIRGLDSRHIHVRSGHAALNTLLQGAGACVMKRALVILDESLQAAGWIPGKHYEFVGNIHDEFQAEVDEDRAEAFAKEAVQAIVKAGEFYNFNVPLDGEAAIGSSWKETH